MTEEQAVAETKYRLAKAVFAALYKDGAITDTELHKLLDATVKWYQPMVGELEVDSIARERLQELIYNQSQQCKKRVHQI